MDLFNRSNRQYLHKVNSYYLKEDKLRKSLDTSVKKYLIGLLKESGDKGYTLLDNKKLLDILYPDKDNKILSKMNLSRIANYFNISSRINTIDYKKGIYLTKDISIGLYPIYDKYDAFNDYDSYIKLVAYFITPDKNINKKITDTIWLEEGVN